MAYVKSIGLNAGESIEKGIDTYLKYLDVGITKIDTVINFNGRNYPIGYFDKNNIDLFKLGLTTISNDFELLARNIKPESEEFKAQGRYFADKCFSSFCFRKGLDHQFNTLSQADPESSHSIVGNRQLPTAFINNILEERNYTPSASGNVTISYY